jgi:hypothetical protein
MYLIPLNQIESVELVIHALKAAGGQADCTSCPAHRVCMKQCLSIAEAVERMLTDETMPLLDPLAEKPASFSPKSSPVAAAEPPGGGHLKLIK